VSWYCALLCAGIGMVAVGLAPRMDSVGKQICELCPVRLSRAKGKLHVHGPGHICTRCYNLSRDRAAASATTPLPTAAKQSRKRRAQSDPGERTLSPRPPPLTRRVSPLQPTRTPPHKKQRVTRQGVAVQRQLDETHARRVAFLASAAASSSSSSSSSTPL
jgi:hypothetical protein